MEEWKTVEIKDICTGIYEGPHATPKESQSGGIYLGIPAISEDGHINFKNAKRISEDDLPLWTKRVTPQEDDIVFTNEATLNLYAIIPAGFHGCLGRRLGLIRLNKELVNVKYLFYYFFSPDWRETISRNKVSGATVERILMTKFPHFPVKLPPLSIQNKIATILSSLDDKIENNRKINENLEQQAQALFKSWFVDFEPFRDQPFVESELGMIPEGWRVGTLSEIADINPIRTLKKGQNAMYLDMKNMPTSGSFPIRWEKKDYTGGMKFKNQDTIMARITPCLENGKVAYINFLNDNEIAFGSTEYIVMTTKDGFMPELLYFLCRDKAFKDYATVNMNGSSGRQRVSGDVIGNYKIVIPPKNIMEPLSNYYKNVMDVIRKNGFENLHLSQLRDTLLPRLMSGEIEILTNKIL